MGSEANKMNDATSFEPSKCANGCGFYGSAATMNLCSQCFKDVQFKNEQAASAKSAVEKLVNKVVTYPSQSTASPSSSSSPPETVAQPTTVEEVRVSNRCRTCNKKIGVMGFKCKCGESFCGSHRYPETHDCEFDFKRSGRENIEKANPVIKADKVNRI